MSKRSRQNARYSRAGRQAREQALRTGVQAPGRWNVIKSLAKAWNASKITWDQIPAGDQAAVAQEVGLEWDGG